MRPAAISRPALIDGVLYGADALVLRWIRRRLPAVQDYGPCLAIGIIRGDAIVAAVVYNNWQPGCADIEITVAALPGARVGLRTVRRILAYPFEDLRCTRVTVRTGRRNKAARSAAEHCGFRLEGVQRRALDGVEDRMIYGMLRAECRFLPQKGP